MYKALVDHMSTDVLQLRKNGTYRQVLSGSIKKASSITKEDPTGSQNLVIKEKS